MGESHRQLTHELCKPSLIIMCMAFSAHPYGMFITLLASLLPPHRTRLHPSVTFVALFRRLTTIPSLWLSWPPHSPLHSSSPICDFCGPLPTSCPYPFVMTVSASSLSTSSAVTPLFHHGILSPSLWYIHRPSLSSCSPLHSPSPFLLTTALTSIFPLLPPPHSPSSFISNVSRHTSWLLRGPRSSPSPNPPASQLSVGSPPLR